jgi:predicted transcriptional regulator YdeE
MTSTIQTITFGPYRALGMSYTGRNENNEIQKIWEQFIPKLCGQYASLNKGGSVGICRCAPGKTDGTFEYVAALLAAPDTAVPDGLVAVEIPQGDYAVFTVPEVDQCKTAWESSFAALAGSEWTSYCNGPDNCQCAAHPSFEFYPPDYRGCGPFSLYIPVKRK